MTTQREWGISNKAQECGVVDILEVEEASREHYGKDDHVNFAKHRW